MPDNKDPVFPRDGRSATDEQLDDARRRLEMEEIYSNLPEVKSHNEPPVMTVYGPPAYFDKNANPAAPAYGPPPRTDTLSTSGSPRRMLAIAITLLILTLTILLGLAAVYFIPAPK